MIKWQIISEADSSVAAVMLQDIETLRISVAGLFDSSPIDYSGVILANKGDTGDGENIEKSCYKNGGYKFLIRNFTESCYGSSEFPTPLLISLLTKLGVLFSKQILSLDPKEVRIESCWAVCQREGDYATIHNHIPPGEDAYGRVSGIMYLQTPSSINPKTFPNGCLHLISAGTVIYCPPIPGSVVMWRSETLHGVHPFRGAGDRLAVSFNLTTQ